MMRELFHSWRRKAGCILLLIALVVMGAHFRSHHYRDWIRLHPTLRHALEINSHPNWVQFVYRCTTQTKGTPPKEPAIKWNKYKLDQVHRGWERPTPDWGKTEWEMGSDPIGREYVISGWSLDLTLPYAMLTGPLVVLAACLIFWPSRKRMNRHA